MDQIITVDDPVLLCYLCASLTLQLVYDDFNNDCFERAIPNLVEPIPAEDASDILKRFRAIGRYFSEKCRMENMEKLSEWDKNRMVLPFSFGKDSLLSLATLRQLGYDVILVNIDERVLPRGKKIREKLKKQMAKDLQLSCHTVTNEIQLLEVSMLTEDKKMLFSLFKEAIHDSDDYHRFIRDEEALAFLFAYRLGAKGSLMDRFQKEFLFHTEKNEIKLRKRIFKLQNGTDGEKSEKEAGTLCQQFLNKYRAW